jgi:hypothetical protein
VNIIALIDTRPELPRETIGTVVSTHDTIRAAFKANEALDPFTTGPGFTTVDLVSTPLCQKLVIRVIQVLLNPIKHQRRCPTPQI